MSMNAGVLQLLPFHVGYAPTLPCFAQLRGMSAHCGGITLRKAMHDDDWGKDPDIEKGFPPPQTREWEEDTGGEEDLDKKGARFSASLMLFADIRFATEDDDKWGDDQDGDNNRRDQSPKKPKISGRLALHAIMLGCDDWPPDTNGNVPLIKSPPSPPDVRTPPEPPPPPPPDSDK